MNAKELRLMMKIAEDIHRLGPAENYLPPGTKLPKIKKPKFRRPPTAEERERFEKLLHTPYGIPPT